MRPLIALLALSLSALSLRGDDNTLLLAGSPPAAGYLFEETFDPTGYDNTGWTESGTVDKDASGLDGSAGALSITDGNISRTLPSGLSEEVWLYFQYRGTTFAAAAMPFVELADSSANIAYRMRSFSTTASDHYHGTTYVSPDIAHAVNNTYGVWVYYKAASASPGSDGVLKVYRSDAGSPKTRPASPQVSTTVRTARVLLNGGSIKILTISATITFDRLIIDDSEIGTLP